MANKMQIRRGLKSKMPILSQAEPGYVTDTNEVYIGTGSGNVKVGGGEWYFGTAMTGTSTTAGAYSYSACPLVKVGDMYLNTSAGYIYQCTAAGSGTSAKWTYKARLSPAVTGGTCATIVIAEAESRHHDAADYICTGSDYQPVIQQAINALPSTGGKIILLEGIYTVNSKITVNKPNVTIEGMGKSTVLVNKANGIMIEVTNGAAGSRLCSFSVDDSATTATASETSTSPTGTIKTNASDISVHDIYFSGGASYSSIAAQNGERIKIYNNVFNGVGLAIQCTDQVHDSIICGNIISNCKTGIRLQQGATLNQIYGNSIRLASEYGIRTAGAHGMVSNNRLYSCGVNISLERSTNSLESRIVAVGNLIRAGSVGISVTSYRANVTGNVIVETTSSSVELGTGARNCVVMANVLGSAIVNSGGTTNITEQNQSIPA